MDGELDEMDGRRFPIQGQFEEVVWKNDEPGILRTPVGFPRRYASPISM
jgi:hypothetical protein